jgi:hypothetical protein
VNIEYPNLLVTHQFHHTFLVSLWKAFWDDALSENRTFIISDLTSASSPLEVDWFEMRRRINYRLWDVVEPSYGPIGVLIPLLPYKDAGWFHCLRDETTGTPTTSLAPTTTLSPSEKPSLTITPTATTSPSQMIRIIGTYYYFRTNKTKNTMGWSQINKQKIDQTNNERKANTYSL